MAGVGNANKARCRAISLWVAVGVTIGVAAVFEQFPASGGAEIYQGKMPWLGEIIVSLFLCIKEGHHHAKTAPLNKE